MRDDRGVLRLSNELIRMILDQIEIDPDRLIDVHRRAYLSQESFMPPVKPSQDQSQDIGNFRLACRRFSELGAIHQFARVTTRFSSKGFKRLEDIARSPHLARHVKKFSYMVPYFYVEGRERVRELPVATLSDEFGISDIKRYEKKVKEQQHIVQSGVDARAIQKAIAAFGSLKHIQILPVQDSDDAALLKFIRRNRQLSVFVELNWAPACSHSTKTVGAALVNSRNASCSRFSSPLLSPQSLEMLSGDLQSPLRDLAHRLTSLELHFDDGTDLDERMLRLSGLFRAVFAAADNMQSIHIGFPTHRPLSLGLEEVFHQVRWSRLTTFGIQGWRLDASEVLALCARHSDRLRGLRLRDVLLKDGSKWEDVLGFLRRDMPSLDWVSLRRIGYVKHFDEQWAVAGAEVADDSPGGASESDETDDESSVEFPILEPSAHLEDDEDENDSSETSSIAASHDGQGMAFPPQLSPTVASFGLPGSRRGAGSAINTEELRDNGIFVSNAQRKMWEGWVLNQPMDISAR